MFDSDICRWWTLRSNCSDSRKIFQFGRDQLRLSMAARCAPAGSAAVRSHDRSRRLNLSRSVSRRLCESAGWTWSLQCRWVTWLCRPCCDSTASSVTAVAGDDWTSSDRIIATTYPTTFVRFYTFLSSTFFPVRFSPFCSFPSSRLPNSFMTGFTCNKIKYNKLQHLLHMKSELQ